MNSFVALADYRRRVAEMYGAVRDSRVPRVARHEWVDTRNELFRTHPQAPIDDPTGFNGLHYFPYDPAWRFVIPVHDAPSLDILIPHSATGETRFHRIGTITLPVPTEPSLDVFWLDAYGGGIFIPFRDASNGSATYGGGRYILDSVKGADLGGTLDELVIDFNFAYHPSCAYSPRWSCPLAPAGNILDIPIDAGERLGERPALLPDQQPRNS